MYYKGQIRGKGASAIQFRYNLF